MPDENERLAAAVNHTQIREQVMFLDDILPSRLTLEDWVEDDSRFETIDVLNFDDPIAIAYAYGHIVGIADAFGVAVLDLVKATHANIGGA